MIIGVLKEPSHETRVSLLPEHLATLKKWNVETVVENNAGVNAFAGISSSHLILGGEFEIMPIHLTDGHLEDIVDAGIVLGASTLGPDMDYNDLSVNHLITLHAGVRVDVNIGRNWGVAILVRGNSGYIMTETGVTVRL